MTLAAKLFAEMQVPQPDDYCRPLVALPTMWAERDAGGAVKVFWGVNDAAQIGELLKVITESAIGEMS